MRTPPLVHGAFGAAVATVLSLSLSPAIVEAAPDSDAAVREASKHFQQGVVLYGEADYRSALVEFKRAAALAPSPTVVYNIAETQFQLHDYANALRSFDRYLAAAGPNDSHHAEVENNLRLLNARVGRLTVMTLPAGADITVDDEAVGKTPFSEPLIVNVGRVRLVAMLAGRAPVARSIDVAAEDNLTVTVELSGAAVAGQETTTVELMAPGDVVARGQGSSGVPGSSSHGSVLRPLGWIVAGVAAAGAITFGLLAAKESRDLKSARESFPTASVRLDDLSRRTQTYSITADALAATAVVATAAMAIWTWSSPRATSREISSARVGVLPGAAVFEMSF